MKLVVIELGIFVYLYIILSLGSYCALIILCQKYIIEIIAEIFFRNASFLRQNNPFNLNIKLATDNNEKRFSYKKLLRISWS